MVLLNFTDTEGWPVWKEFKSVKKAEKYVRKNFDPEHEWHNPCPTIIKEDLSRQTFEGFEYS